MIEYLIKDLTTVEKGLILHGCNCVGGFGSGVAGAIRRKWPEVYKAFKANGTGKALLGSVDFVHIKQELDPVCKDIIVVNGYTQEFCGNDGKRYADLDAVAGVIDHIISVCNTFGYDLYMPKIGCGLGGLSWEDEVKPLIEKASSSFPRVNIFICDI